MATPNEIRSAVEAVSRGEIRYRFGIYEGGPEWQVIHEIIRLGLAERDPEGGDVPVVLTDAGRASLGGEPTGPHGWLGTGSTWLGEANRTWFWECRHCGREGDTSEPDVHPPGPNGCPGPRLTHEVSDAS